MFSGSCMSGLTSGHSICQCQSGQRRPDGNISQTVLCATGSDCVRVADVYVSHLSRGRTLFLTRYGGARTNRSTRFLARTCASRRWFLLLAEPDLYWLSPVLSDHHRRLSVCSLPVLKQSEGSLGRSTLLCPVGNQQDLAACALWNLVFFVVVALRGGAALLFSRYKRSLLAIDREQIGHHLARYRQGGSIGRPFLFFFFVDQSELMTLARNQLRRLD
jgi:hypothetical protein